MADLKDAIKLILGLVVVAAGVWAYIHLLCVSEGARDTPRPLRRQQ
jgi:hypothetical protein